MRRVEDRACMSRALAILTYCLTVHFSLKYPPVGWKEEVRWLRIAKRNNKMDTRTLRTTLLEPCGNSALLLENVERNVCF